MADNEEEKASEEIARVIIDAKNGPTIISDLPPEQLVRVLGPIMETLREQAAQRAVLDMLQKLQKPGARIQVVPGTAGAKAIQELLK